MPDLTVKHGCKHQAVLANAQRKTLKYLLGFSLLELLVVIGLLGIVGLTATTYLIDTGEEKRKEITERNWDAIRKAVIGDSTQSLNNTQMLNGYVLDMGRLPENIKELMSKGAQPAWTALSISGMIGAIPGVTGTLYAGWRGPYLYSAGSAEYHDGWMNDADPPDGLNFGWLVSLDDVSASNTKAILNVQSLGEGNEVGGLDEYSNDFPAGSGTMVNASDWQVGVSNVVFDIVFTSGVSPTATSNPLELRIYSVDAITTPTISDNEKQQFTYAGVSATGTHQQQVSVSFADPIPMGRYAAAILCTDGVSPTATATGIYDGDCAAPHNNKEVYYFTMLPSTHQVTVRWNTP